MTEPLLVLTDVHKRFDLRAGGLGIFRGSSASLVALDGVSLELHEQEILGVVGESGSGKSTLAKAIVRLNRPESGTVAYRGRDVFALERRDAAETTRRIQLIYQDPYSSLNPRMKVKSAIGEAARVHRYAERSTVDAVVKELLSKVHLAPGVAELYPRELSGGQRQRVAIARALAARPEILIADEAVSALDVSVQAQVLNLLLELQQELKLAVLFISHQLAVVSQVASRIAVMYLGRIVETGPVEEVFHRPSHPYTQALLAAQPGAHRRGEQRVPALRGEIPSPMDIPAGCRFRTRCRFAEERCASIDPPAAQVAPDHLAWCHVLPPPAAPPHVPVEPSRLGDAAG